MPAVAHAEIQAARARLRGHLVSTPVIGGLLLPGRSVSADVRVKPEVLQPTGSLYFRGAQHWLLRQLGACKGLVAHGPERVVAAAAVAGSQHRLPLVAFVAGPLSESVSAMLGAVGCDVRSTNSPTEARRGAQDVRAREGYAIAPGLEDVDYAAGVATVGLELAEELPAETTHVVIGPGKLSEPVACGLAAGGVAVSVAGVDAADDDVPVELLAEVRAALRLDIGRASAAALWHAMAHSGGPVCAVLAE